MSTPSELALVRTVLIHGPLSRAELAVRLGLSPASLTRLAKPFLERGDFIELDDVIDGVGRPSRPLDISPTLGSFLGVKLTGEEVHATITDVHARPLAELRLPLPDHDPAAAAAVIVRARDELASRGLEAPPLRGVGVSLGGSVDHRVVEWAPFLGWSDVPLGDLLEEALGLPVRLENDLIALAEAELWFGAGRGLPGFSVITIGVGVGYGVVANGDVVRTRDAGVGMGGHIPLTPHGPLCQEGHHGCAQAMLTSGSIAAQVSAALQRPVGYDEVLDLAAAGVPAAEAVVDAAAEALGRLIALSANLTMYPDVVLAGEGIRLFAVAEDRIRAAIAAGRDPRATSVALHVDDSGFAAWARGAAAVAVRDVVLGLP
ncbi:ROK family protein [Microbacterium xylanilyticum]